MPDYKIIQLTGSEDPGTSLDVGQIGYRTGSNELYIGNGIGNSPKKFLTGDLNVLALLSGSKFEYPITCQNLNLYNSDYIHIENIATLSFNNSLSKNYSLNENGFCNITIDSSGSSVGDYLILRVPPNSPISSFKYNGTIYKQKNLSITSVYAIDYKLRRMFSIRYGGNNRIFITMDSYQ